MVGDDGSSGNLHMNVNETTAASKSRLGHQGALGEAFVGFEQDSAGFGDVSPSRTADAFALAGALIRATHDVALGKAASAHSIIEGLAAQQQQNETDAASRMA
ncbi:MAG TPA: hypothetical protein VH561_12875 [Micromonosporaceae bacterium]|jgi:hypothetical protein